MPEEPGPGVGECCVSSRRGKEGRMEGKGCGTGGQSTTRDGLSLTGIEIDDFVCCAPLKPG